MVPISVITETPQSAVGGADNLFSASVVRGITAVSESKD